MNQISETRAEQLNRQPIIECSVRKSKDGQWVIHKTVITDIKPVSYLKKVMEGQAAVEA